MTFEQLSLKHFNFLLTNMIFQMIQSEVSGLRAMQPIQDYVFWFYESANESSLLLLHIFQGEAYCFENHSAIWLGSDSPVSTLTSLQSSLPPSPGPGSPNPKHQFWTRDRSALRSTDSPLSSLCIVSGKAAQFLGPCSVTWSFTLLR